MISLSVMTVFCLFYNYGSVWTEVNSAQSIKNSPSMSAEVSGNVDERSTIINIGGIFPMTGSKGWLGGQACLPSALMALEDVNARKDLLSGYTLNMVWNDSKCEPGLGARVMYDLLYRPPQKLMLLGGCSTVCTTVAEAAKMWNLIVLSYGSSSPALSDRDRFPTFFRTHPSATVHNPTRIGLFKQYGWTKIAILQEAEEVFISTVKDMEVRCKETGIEIISRQSFLSDPSDAVKNLKLTDARIIVGLFYVGAARRVLCEIYQQGMYGKSFVWFFIGWYEDNWFEVNLDEENIDCTPQQMALAAEGHITTEALMWDQDNKTTISGMTAGQFRVRLNNRLKASNYNVSVRIPDGYQEAPLAYDAIWAIALALNKTSVTLSRQGLRLEDFTYTDGKIAEVLYTAMNSTSFMGVSGLVKFSTDGDRVARTQFEQLQNGKYVRLGYYDTNTDNLTFLRPVKWIHNKVPQDRTIIKRTLRTISLPLFVSMCTLSLIGIVVAVVFLIFNRVFRQKRFISLSHPVCNDVTLIGIIVCLLAVMLLGLDGRFLSNNYYSFACYLRAWSLSIGFTLSYGSMFTKVWRVHKFATLSEDKIKVEPWRLYVMLGFMIIVDVVILVPWHVVNPLYRDIESFPLEDPVDSMVDIKFLPQLEHCQSDHMFIWLGLLYGFKGLLLVFGLFLSYETRSVKLKEINDSRLVGMSVYNVVVLCLITAPVSIVISSQQDASYAFISLAIIFCCYISMGLIFVPKVIHLLQNPHEEADASDLLASREEEDRYRRIQKENVELQRQISEKEENIRILRQVLEERAAAKTTGGVFIAAPALGLVAASRFLAPSPSPGDDGRNFSTAKSLKMSFKDEGAITVSPRKTSDQ